LPQDDSRKLKFSKYFAIGQEDYSRGIQVSDSLGLVSTAEKKTSKRLTRRFFNVDLARRIQVREYLSF